MDIVEIIEKRKWIIGIVPYLDDDGVPYIPKGYLKGIERIGGEPREIAYETPLDRAAQVVDELDGMLFSGGVDVDPSCYGAAREPECGESNPLRDALEPELLRACLKRKLPILGICRGCQIINAALGGTLVQDVPKRFGKVHQMAQGAPSAFDHMVRVVPGTMLAEIMGGDVWVDSYHHQCVDRLAGGLVPSAYAPEGFVEAYEMPRGEQFLMAVQWHPEITLDDDMYSMRIFERFRQAIEAHRAAK